MANEIVLTINGTNYSDNWESITIEDLGDVITGTIVVQADNTTVTTDIQNGVVVRLLWNDGIVSTLLWKFRIIELDYNSDDSVKFRVMDEVSYLLRGWSTGDYDVTGNSGSHTNAITNALCSEYLDENPPWIVQPDVNTDYGSHIKFRAQNISRITALKNLAKRVGYITEPSWDGSENSRFNIAPIATLSKSGDSGTATGHTATTLIDSGKSWTPDAWIDYKVVITGGTGEGQVRAITDNDATSLTVAEWTTHPSTDSTYAVVPQVFFTYGDNQNVSDASRKKDTDQLWNVVYVLGFGDGSQQIISDGSHYDPDSITTWGRRDKEHVDRTITVEAEANRLAALILADHHDPINKFTLNVEDASLILPTTGASVVMSVNVNDNIVIMDDNVYFGTETTIYRVKSMTYEFQPGQFNCRLECASRTYAFVDEMKEIADLSVDSNSYAIINELTENTAESLNSISAITGVSSGTLIGKIDASQTTVNQDHSSNEEVVAAAGGAAIIVQNSDYGFSVNINDINNWQDLWDLGTIEATANTGIILIANVYDGESAHTDYPPGSEKSMYIRLRNVTDSTSYPNDSMLISVYSLPNTVIFASGVNVANKQLKLQAKMYIGAVYCSGTANYVIKAQHQHTLSSTGGGGLIASAGVLLEKTSVVTTTTTDSAVKSTSSSTVATTANLDTRVKTATG